MSAAEATEVLVARQAAEAAAEEARVAEEARIAEEARLATRVEVVTPPVLTPSPQRVAPPPPRNWDTFAACVIAHESGGNPRAQNPSSSASGLFQDLDSTWGGYGGYAHAKDAPVALQYQMNYELWLKMGGSPWAGSGC